MRQEQKGGRDEATKRNLWYFFNSDTYFVCDWKSRRHQPMPHKPRQRLLYRNADWLPSCISFPNVCRRPVILLHPYCIDVPKRHMYISWDTTTFYPVPKRKIIPLNEIYLSIHTIPVCVCVCIAKDISLLKSKHMHAFTQQFYSKHIKMNANVIKCTIQANSTSVKVKWNNVNAIKYRNSNGND